MNIKFSIIIPTLNSEKTIKKCISSVIHQSYRNWEIIVVDASSNDLTFKILKKFKNKKKFFYFKSKLKKGLAYDRYIGISKSKGNYVCFLDSDDSWLKNKLLNQYNLIIKQNAKFMCSNYILNFKKKKLYSSFKNVSTDYHNSLSNRFISNSSVAVNRKEILKVAKKFNANIMAEDYLWWLLLLKNHFKRCYIINSHDVVINYSVNSRTTKITSHFRSLIYIYNKILKIPLYKVIYHFCILSLNTFKKNLFKLKLLINV